MLNCLSMAQSHFLASEKTALKNKHISKINTSSKISIPRGSKKLAHILILRVKNVLKTKVKSLAFGIATLRIFFGLVVIELDLKITNNQKWFLKMPYKGAMLDMVVPSIAAHWHLKRTKH